MTLTRVIIESPFAALTDEGRAINLCYARACLLDSLRRGEAPFASHLLYPKVLDDAVPGDRTLGIQAGFAWAEVANRWIFYTDLGLSPGMQAALEKALNTCGPPATLRRLWPQLEHPVYLCPTVEDGERQAAFCRRFLSDAEILRLLSAQLATTET